MNIKLSLRLANHLFQHLNGEISVRNSGKTITQKRNTACINPKPNIRICREIAGILLLELLLEMFDTKKNILRGMVTEIRDIDVFG